MKKYILYSIIACIVIIAIALSPYYRVDILGATKTLKSSGYSPLEVGGYDWFSGSKSDFYSTKFKAISPSKDTVTGTVTKGFFKGSTIRLD
jgi:hypothetical protein